MLWADQRRRHGSHLRLTSGSCAPSCRAGSDARCHRDPGRCRPRHAFRRHPGLVRLPAHVTEPSACVRRSVHATDLVTVGPQDPAASGRRRPGFCSPPPRPRTPAQPHQQPAVRAASALPRPGQVDARSRHLLLEERERPRSIEQSTEGREEPGVLVAEDRRAAAGWSGRPPSTGTSGVQWSGGSSVSV